MASHPDPYGHDRQVANDHEVAHRSLGIHPLEVADPDGSPLELDHGRNGPVKRTVVVVPSLIQFSIVLDTVLDTVFDTIRFDSIRFGSVRFDTIRYNY